MEGDSREKCDQSHIDGVLVASVIGDAESETESGEDYRAELKELSQVV